MANGDSVRLNDGHGDATCDGTPATREAKRSDGSDVRDTLTTNVLLMFLGVVTGSVAARVLGPEGRGELAALQLWLLAIAGIGSAGFVEATGFFSGRRPGSSRTVTITAAFMLSLLSIPASVAGILLMPHLLAAQPARVIHWAQLYMLALPSIMVSQSAFMALRATGAFRAWNRLRLLLPVGYLAILLTSLFFPEPRLPLIAFAYFGFLVAQLAVAVWVIGTRLTGPRVIDRTLFRPMARFGILALGSTLPGMLNFRLDQLVMAAVLPARDLGLYAVAVSWSMGFVPLAGTLTMIILPRLAPLTDPGEVRVELLNAWRAALCANVALGVALLLVTAPAFYILFGERFLPAIPSALVLVGAAVFWGMNAFLEQASFGLGRPGIGAVAQGVGMIATLGLLYLLIPSLGILGAATASLAAYAAVQAVLTALLLRHVRGKLSEVLIVRRDDVRQFGARLRSFARAAMS